MAEFGTFDLGKIIQTAEAIKGLRRQEETDRLQQAYFRNRETREAAQEDRAATQFTQEQQLTNTKLLNAAAAEVAQDPSAVTRWIPQLQQAGIIPAGDDGAWQNVDPAQLQAAAQRIFESTSRALNSINPSVQSAEAAHALRLKELEQGQKYELEQISARGSQDRATAAAGTPGKAVKTAQQLRKEFEGMDAVKNYATVLPIIQSAKQSPDNGYGDLDMIYAVGKILDPNSVVREGELALTIAAGSPLQRILGTTRFTIEKGGRLTPTQRKQILGMLDGRVGALKTQYTHERERFAKYAQEAGLEPEQVVGKERGAPNRQPEIIQHPSGATIEILED